MKSFFIFLLTFLTGSFTAQVKLIVTVPSTTPENTKIYMASSLNSWNPADSGFELKKNAPGKYELHIPENSGKVEYKSQLPSFSVSLHPQKFHNVKVTYPKTRSH